MQLRIGKSHSYAPLSQDAPVAPANESPTEEDAGLELQSSAIPQPVDSQSSFKSALSPEMIASLAGGFSIG